MNKLKVIYVCLFISFLTLMIFSYQKIKKHEEMQQKMVLAQGLQKVFNSMMLDLIQSRQRNIRDVPPDGVWYHHLTLRVRRKEVIEYLVNGHDLYRVDDGQPALIVRDIVDLRIRRQNDSPGILEIQIEAHKNVSLVSNLKIRVSR